MPTAAEFEKTIKSGELIESRSEMTPEYLHELKHTLVVSGDTELISAPAYYLADRARRRQRHVRPGRLLSPGRPPRQVLLWTVEARTQQGDGRRELPPAQRPHLDEAHQPGRRLGQGRAAARCRLDVPAQRGVV